MGTGLEKLRAKYSAGVEKNPLLHPVIGDCCDKFASKPNYTPVRKQIRGFFGSPPSSAVVFPKSILSHILQTSPPLYFETCAL